MPKSKNKRKKLNPSDHQKNLARGVVAASRSHAFKTDLDIRAAVYHEGVQRIMTKATSNLPVDKYQDFLSWFEQQNAALIDVAKVLPHSYSFLSKHYDDSAELENQFVWCLTRIMREQTRITEFLKIVGEIEKQVILGNAEIVQTHLQNIEQIFGPSIWLVEAKISIAQLFHGLEQQKKVMEQIRFKEKRGLAPFIAHMVSMRNEPSMTQARYKTMAAARIERFTSKSMQAYLQYRLLGDDPINAFQSGSILGVEKSHSIIDIYETVLRLMQSWAHTPAYSLGTKLLTLGLERLNDIDDFRLVRLKAETEIKSDLFTTDCDLSVVAPKSMYRLLVRKFEQGEANVWMLREAAACVALLTERDIPDDLYKVWKWIIFRIAEAIRLDSRALMAYGALQRFSLNFGYLPLFKCLQWQLVNKNINKFDSTSVDHRSYYNDRDSLGSASVNRNTLFIETNRIGKFGSDSSTYIFPSTWEADDAPTILRVISKVIRARLLVKDGQVAAALDLMTDLAVNQSVDPTNLPIKEALAGLDWAALRQYASNISLSICLDLYSRQTDLESVESLKRYSFDEYIESLGGLKPSEVLWNEKPIPKGYVVYFLKHLCIPRVMELCMLFPNSRALDEERRDVCVILQKLDKNNVSAYQTEVIQITNMLTIDEGIRLVDSSRIHVDTEMVRRKVIKDVDADFSRYKALVAAGIGVADSFDNVLRLLIKTSADDEAILNVPENEADDLLVQVVRSLKERFLLDAEHGLDSFLSKRVRHNSFAGQLRGPVDAAHLVTLYDIKRKRYHDNEYWNTKLQALDTQNRERIKKALVEFTERFTSISKDVPNKILRVRTSEFPHGIFDIPLDNRMMQLLRSVATEDQNADDFISTCFSAFWGRLAPSLALARSLLETNTKEAISDCFQRLRAVVASVAESDADKVAELSTEIGMASTGVFRQLDVITGWFNKREISFSKQYYSLEDAVNITVGATLAAHRNIKVNIKKSLQNDVRIAPGGLFVIADVIWVTLDNACSYSQLDNDLCVKISMELVNAGSALRIRVENNLAANVRTLSEEKKLEKIRSDIEEKRHIERLRSEGKSGLKKIAALALSSDSGRWDFGYIGQTGFYVELDLAFIDELVSLDVPEIKVDPNVAEASYEITTG